VAFFAVLLIYNERLIREIDDALRRHG
jgi:hypothetical protein